MPSPIFYPLFMKRYLVQTRSGQGPWKDYGSYANLKQAERAVRELMKQKAGMEGRIFNRLTGQVVGNYQSQN